MRHRRAVFQDNRKNREKKKIIVCDEAWLFLKYQESAEFLVNVARRGRKYNVPLFIRKSIY